MKYFLIYALLGSGSAPSVTGFVGPFDGILACEKAATQILVLKRDEHSRLETVCVATRTWPTPVKKPGHKELVK